MAPAAIVYFIAFALTVSHVSSTKNYYASARVESCSGCRLSRLPDIHRFIKEDLHHYENVEFKHVPGALPELLLFNDKDEEVERIALSALTRQECNELLQYEGFKRKATRNEM